MNTDYFFILSVFICVHLWLEIVLFVANFVSADLADDRSVRCVLLLMGFRNAITFPLPRFQLSITITPDGLIPLAEAKPPPQKPGIDPGIA